MMRFTHALARRPVKTVGQGLTTQVLGAPDAALTLKQYQAYLDALRGCGVAVEVLPGDEQLPDGHYVEDTAVIWRDLAVITQPGAVSRRNEPQAIERALSHFKRVCMSGDAHLDGGDVLFCAERVLIGLTKRTNRAGAEFLRNALCEYDASLKVDFVPVDGVLHLKSGITELAPGVLLHSPELVTDFDLTFAEVHRLPPEEGYAANVLSVNGAVFISKGFPTVRQVADKYYTQVVELEMSEFRKMDGALTCLSLRFNV